MTALKYVAELMAVAARTAPKAKGEDFVVVKIVQGEEIKQLAQTMFRRAEKTGNKNWARDGRNTEQSEAIVLIGIKDGTPAGLNCGACGMERCLKINTVNGEFRGPQCLYRVLDLGIALGSAVKMASILNVDNRIMYRVGSAAREANLIDADFVMGIPLSATGKSIYFDR